MDIFFSNDFRKLYVPWAVFIFPTTCLVAELCVCPQLSVDMGHMSCALFPPIPTWRGIQPLPWTLQHWVTQIFVPVGIQK